MIIPAHSIAFKMLDHIADATNPLLGIALIVGLVLLWRRDKNRFWSILIASLVSILLFVLIKNIEGHNHVWADWGMNFSSHAATTIAFCVPLALIWQKRWLLFLAIFIAYAALMMLLGFHTLADIVTTTAVIFPICGVCQFVAWRRNKLPIATKA